MKGLDHVAVGRAVDLGRGFPAVVSLGEAPTGLLETLSLRAVRMVMSLMSWGPVGPGLCLGQAERDSVTDGSGSSGCPSLAYIRPKEPTGLGKARDAKPSPGWQC